MEHPFAMVVTDAQFSAGSCAYCAKGAVPGGGTHATSEDDWSRYCSEACLAKDSRLGHLYQVSMHFGDHLRWGPLAVGTRLLWGLLTMRKIQRHSLLTRLCFDKSIDPPCSKGRECASTS